MRAPHSLPRLSFNRAMHHSTTRAHTRASTRARALWKTLVARLLRSLARSLTCDLRRLTAHLFPSSEATSLLPTFAEHPSGAHWEPSLFSAFLPAWWPAVETPKNANVGNFLCIHRLGPGMSCPSVSNEFPHDIDEEDGDDRDRWTQPPPPPPPPTSFLV